MIKLATSPLMLSLLIIGMLVTAFGIFTILEDHVKRWKLRERLSRRSKSGPDRFEKVKGATRSPSIVYFRKNIFWLMIGSAVGLLLVNFKPFHDWSIGIRLLLFVMALYVFYRIPHMRAEQAAKMRKNDIERDLPSIIDLLIIMLDAGATFDDALLRLVEDRRFPDQPIKQELKRLASELSISTNRQSAFEKFSSSIAINDLRLFCSVLVQSEIYGTPVSRGLRGLAHDIRERQYLAVEASGGTLGPKLTLPMTLFFLPLIFIVVLAPTVIRAFHLP
jgi:tight adherence protein C